MTCRRHVLRGTAVILVGGVAGCQEDVETEFLVSNTQLVHYEGSDEFDYPEDIAVRVEMENTAARREDGTLTVTLYRIDEDGTELDSWTQTHEVSVSGGTILGRIVVFESVVEPGEGIDDFRVEARLEADG